MTMYIESPDWKSSMHGHIYGMHN